MKNERRNDKQHQRRRLQDFSDATETIRDLHRLVARPGRGGLSVGEMVNVAAKMGLLESPRRSVVRFRKLQEEMIA